MNEITEVIDIMEKATVSMETSHKSLTQKIGIIEKLRAAHEWIVEHSTDPDAVACAERALEE